MHISSVTARPACRPDHGTIGGNQVAGESSLAGFTSSSVHTAGGELCHDGEPKRGAAMRIVRFVVAASVTFWMGLGVHAQQPAPQPASGTGAQGGGRAAGPRGSATPGQLIGGTGTIALTPVDARGWGWQVKASVSPATPRPFYNKAKELLFQDKQITSYTISSYNPELYCEVGKHFDFIWFEMQHSTMSWDEVRRMMLACPGVGAAPMVRMPDAFESSIQKATDIGAVGIIVPTVDDALEARDAGRFSRYPPVGRRSSGGGSFGQVWPGINYRATINDNMLVTVMIETLEGVANAEEIAATAGVDVVIFGNNDLSAFSGWQQRDPRYQDALIKVRNAALKYGKYYGNAGQQYLNGYVVSADTRMVQDGPARDGWQRPARGGGAAGARGAAPAPGGRGRGQSAPEEPEPVIGLPGGAGPATPATAAPAGGRGR
jgi:2-keto-3-deoxy-L-rhamnonate aldolase RhmA